MVRFTASALLAFAVSASLVSAQLPDPNGAKNIGVPLGQTIGGQCLSSGNCAQNSGDPTAVTCCAFLVRDGQETIGVCSSSKADVPFQAGKQGCGFGDGASSAPAASIATTSAAPSSTATFFVTTTITPSSTATATNSGPLPTVTLSTVRDDQGPANVGKKNHLQFVQGVCTSDDDCQSTCCSGGVCRNEPALQNGQVCGFVAQLVQARAMKWTA
ncbi:hypothetical protein F5Y18DRAFT_358151 [Xylariaceae sp. FL1019]|nr:hypothetical protein F5Y18DRAFT_358151 [Xylariaceae sp. FL1019]